MPQKAPATLLERARKKSKWAEYGESAHCRESGGAGDNPHEGDMQRNGDRALAANNASKNGSIRGRTKDRPKLKKASREVCDGRRKGRRPPTRT